MKLFQVLIALFILTVSASVYAMGIYLQPASFSLHRQPIDIKLNADQPAVKIKSQALKKIQFLADQQKFSRLLAASS